MIGRFDNLIKLATRYALLSEATLRSDMAKRIMYSILPGVASPAQNIANQGTIDLKALRAAVEGRKDIIKYGVSACVKELKHYGGSLTIEDKKPYYVARSYANSSDNEKAVDIAIKLFGDERAWSSSYGGEAWLNIAKTLKQIISLDKELAVVRANRATDPEAIDKEIIIMQRLIIALNVFDGLSHNTASILSNLVEEEAWQSRQDEQPGETIDAAFKEFQALQKMMDAKELRNPIQVFREIEPSLIGSGDINRYKDWVSQLRRDPTYGTKDPNLEEEKFLIRFRKQILNFRKKINTERDYIKNNMDMLTTIPLSEGALYKRIEIQTEEFTNTIDHLLQLIEKQYIYPSDNVEFQINNNLKEGLIRKIQEDLKKIWRNALIQVETARNKLKPIITKYYQQKQKGVISQKMTKELQDGIYEMIKTIYDVYGSLSFYLDSI